MDRNTDLYTSSARTHARTHERTHTHTVQTTQYQWKVAVLFPAMHAPYTTHAQYLLHLSSSKSYPKHGTAASPCSCGCSLCERSLSSSPIDGSWLSPAGQGISSEHTYPSHCTYTHTHTHIVYPHTHNHTHTHMPTHTHTHIQPAHISLLPFSQTGTHTHNIICTYIK